MVERKKYCVGGEWLFSKSEKYFEITDSSTGKVIAEVPHCTKQEVLSSIEEADKAYKIWSKTSLSYRTKMLFKWKNILEDHLEELTYICAKELGKTLNEARGDVLKAIEPTEHACSISTLIQGDASLQVTNGYDCSTYRMPLGVVVGIVPLNFPAMIPWGWMVPLAIATGNTVVLKANNQTPLTSMRILELFYEKGQFPKGIVNLVTCDSEEAEILLRDHRVKAVTFVGTTKVGKHIYSIAAANGKRVQAQTEAKNHAMILKDADLDSTVNSIINSAFGCGGMRCMALSALVVEDSIADEFIDILMKRVKSLKVGCAYDESSEMGALVSKEHKEKVIKWIEKGINEGATLLLDGRDIKVKGFEKGFFVGPTIFDNVKPNMSIGNEEIFGPVLSIKRVKDFYEGIKIMNNNPFANGSSIYTKSGFFAREFEMLTDGGMVGINIGIPVPTTHFPFSGNKDSFFGDLHVLGKDGIRFFTRAKTVTRHWFNEESKNKIVGTWEGTLENS